MRGWFKTEMAAQGRHSRWSVDSFESGGRANAECFSRRRGWFAMRSASYIQVHETRGFIGLFGSRDGFEANGLINLIVFHFFPLKNPGAGVTLL